MEFFSCLLGCLELWTQIPSLDYSASGMTRWCKYGITGKKNEWMDGRREGEKEEWFEYLSPKVYMPNLTSKVLGGGTFGR